MRMAPDMLRYLKEAAALDPQPSPLLQRIEQFANFRALPIEGISTAKVPVEDLAEHREHFLVERAVVRQQVLGAGYAVRAAAHVGLRPPASRTSSVPAAMSHGFSPNSQKKSSRPQATYARSIAADPVRRTPCDAIAI